MERAELMLQKQVVEACRQSLRQGAQRRQAINSQEKWAAWRQQVLEAVKKPFPQVIFKRNQIQVRSVSSHTFPEFRLENVLFESLPGWEVNATVYLPKEPGVYPGVVCPTGHSNKTEVSYQHSAQVFARNGYIAVSFDPPGCSGELTELNDHFTNGLIGYLTGFWSQSHFVVDAMRCLDYLETRSDVEQGAGFAMTGVSGGGLTSLMTALLDERVAFVGPACCLADHESLHLQGLYTSCPEQFGIGYIAAGLDYVDCVAALAPRPCLLMAGAEDEVFDVQATERLGREVKRLYREAGAPHACDLFVDHNSGHAYTVAMACEAVGWMNRVFKGSNAPARDLTPADMTSIGREKLLCHPASAVNMFTVNQNVGRGMERARNSQSAAATLRTAAAQVLGIEGDSKPVRVEAQGAAQRSWHALVEEVDIQPVEEVHLPGLMLSHVGNKEPRPGLLWLDDQGRWAALRQNGFLVPPLRMFEADCKPNQPHILSMEVSGLGALEPAPVAYDLAAWNDSERILTYLAIANEQPIMGLRVRDALCGLAYLAARPEVDEQRLMVGGRGVGAIVALHVALLGTGVKKVICLEMLSHYGALTEHFPFTWRQSAIIPDVLKHYDLPEIAAALKDTQVHVINPLDVQQKVLAKAQAMRPYSAAVDAGAVVQCRVDGEAAVVQALGSR